MGAHSNAEPLLKLTNRGKYFLLGKDPVISGPNLSWNPEDSIESIRKPESENGTAFQEWVFPRLVGVRSPCWFHSKKYDQFLSRQPSHTRAIYCLPSFFVLGQPKCGTTDLSSMINNHPEVVTAQASEHWWARKRFDYRNSLNGYIDHYRELISVEREFCTHGRYNPICNRVISGDFSPSTLWDSSNTMKAFSALMISHPNLRNFLIEQRSGPLNTSYVNLSFLNTEVSTLSTMSIPQDFTFGLPDLIRSVLPQARFIVILRDPTERLYSGFHYFKKTGDFRSCVRQTLSLWNTCLESSTVRECAYNKSLQTSMPLRLHIGLYWIYLSDWLKVFPRDQFLILRLEDYAIDRTAVLDKVFYHLGLRPLSLKDKEHVLTRSIKNKNKKRETIPPDCKEILDQFHRPHNQQLEKILQDSRFLWSS